MAQPASGLIKAFQDLTGQLAPFPASACNDADALFLKGGIGWSQFNEIMILLGYDRVSEAFFQFLVDGTPSYQKGASISSSDHLRQAVDRFRKLAMLRFGNIRHAFKVFSKLESHDLTRELDLIAPIPEEVYKRRHDPVRPIEPIAGDDTYYLGYLIAADIEAKLKADPNDQTANDEKEKRQRIIEQGIRNHESYLASDHMDVYVATSMRERHEYYFVNKISSKIFNDKRLRQLNLRWFDPTQAYCHDRIDKGLAEALMLKRALCTLYFAQESDTLGKDSELASTLAQGKPVIAFVPKIHEKDDTYLRWLLQEAKRIYPKQDLIDLIRQQFELFAPRNAWHDPWVKKWIHDPSSKTQAEAERKLLQVIRKHYDKRANTLKETHPLGIQVNLDTGVANGVLVARTTDECSELIYRVVTNTLQFNLETKRARNQEYLLLRETVSGSVFRVVTGDPLLTNAFWNFYLE